MPAPGKWTSKKSNSNNKSVFGRNLESEKLSSEKWFKQQRKTAIKRRMNVEEAAAFEGFSHILGKDNVIFSPKHGNNKSTDLLVRTSNGKNVLVKTKYNIDEKEAGKLLDNYGKCHTCSNQPARLVLMTSTPVSDNVKKMVEDYNNRGKRKLSAVEKELSKVDSQIESEKTVILEDKERKDLLEQWNELQYLINRGSSANKSKSELKGELESVQGKIISDNNARERHRLLLLERKNVQEKLDSSRFHEASVAPSAQLGNVLAYKLRSEEDSMEKRRLLGIAKGTLGGSFYLQDAAAPEKKIKYPSEKLTKNVLNFLERGLSIEYEPLASNNKTPDFMVTGANGESHENVSMMVEVKSNLNKRTYQKVKSGYQEAKFENADPKVLTIVSYTPVSGELWKKNWEDLHQAVKTGKMPVVVLGPRELKRAINSKISYMEKKARAGEISKEAFSEIKTHGEQLLELIEKERKKKD
jgi:hypothetical protein